MKRFILLSIWMFMGILVLEAQAPEKFSYQAVVRDASNNLVVNQSVGLRITIQQGMPGGTEVYQETHTVMTNANGLVSLEVGGGTSAMVGDFSDIDWGEGPYYIQTEIDPAGGTAYSIMGSTQLISVPYALHAGNVKKYKIGELAHGGMVFYVEPCGTKGLVAAEADQNGGVGIRWYAGDFGNTQAKGDGPYAGKANTSIIIAAHVAIGDDGNTYAARICNELQITQDGITYGDWYLPSLEELRLMYNNIGQGSSLGNVGNFTVDYYWSGTEYFFGDAWGFSFGNAFANLFSKNFNLRVRAVRAF